MSDSTKRKVDSTKHVKAELTDYAKKRKKTKMLGKGMARKAGDALSKRKGKIDKALKDAGA